MQAEERPVMRPLVAPMERSLLDPCNLGARAEEALHPRPHGSAGELRLDAPPGCRQDDSVQVPQRSGDLHLWADERQEEDEPPPFSSKPPQLTCGKRDRGAARGRVVNDREAGTVAARAPHDFPLVSK
jgi:hypothetical protein